MNDKEEQARKLFEGGANINAVAKQLGVGWSTARSWKNDMGTDTAEQPASQEGLVFTMSLEVPVGKVGTLIRGIEAEEIMDAVLNLDEGEQLTILQAVMQRRLNSVLEPTRVNLTLPQSINAA